MRLLDRNIEHPVTSTRQPDESGNEQNALRDQAAALAAAADEAISRALSRDSARFLAQNRQAGGQ